MKYQNISAIEKYIEEEEEAKVCFFLVKF